MELIAINIRLPHVLDVRILEVVGAGIMVMFDNHKKLGTALDDFLIKEEAKLTMGDHCSELIYDADEFVQVYAMASLALDTLLATQTTDLESLARQIDGIEDIMVLEYPGLIKMYVREGKISNGVPGYRLFHFLN